MAEQEISKHTKKIFSHASDPHRSWQHRIGEILLEIVIIVFAVSISIWFHNLSEQRNSRHEEKEFLTGLVGDLASDTIQMNGDLNAYRELERGVQYLLRVSYGEKINMDSFRLYRGALFSTTKLEAASGRFEALKASGKLEIIENKELLANILNYYQNNLVLINQVNDIMTSYKQQRIAPIIDEKSIQDQDGNGNWEDVLRYPPMRNVLSRLKNIDNWINDYQIGVHSATMIIAQIKAASH